MVELPKNWDEGSLWCPFLKEIASEKMTNLRSHSQEASTCFTVFVHLEVGYQSYEILKSTNDLFFIFWSQLWEEQEIQR